MDRIEQAAHRLISNLGTSSPFDLCEQLGIPVLHMELPEHINGFTFQKNGKNTIVLNFKQQNDRYICAHELGHIVLHAGLNAVFIRNYTDHPCICDACPESFPWRGNVRPKQQPCCG